MNDEQAVLALTLNPLLSTHATPERVMQAEGSWDEPLWKILDETGFTAIGTPEQEGGSGGDLALACAVVRVAARYAAPVPLAETLILAPWLRRQAGLAYRPGPSAVAVLDKGQVTKVGPETWRIEGNCDAVAWATVSARILIAAREGDSVRVFDVPTDHLKIRGGMNCAGEPADCLELDGVEIDGTSSGLAPIHVLPGLRQVGSLARTVMMAGAMEALLSHTCAYVREREQFGGPIARFQAVKHHVAELAGEVAVARAAAHGAAASFETRGRELSVAAARVRVSQASSTATRIAHQLHGAMGFTREHPLHLFSRRLWAWRDEYGTQGEWELELGRRVCAAGPNGLWSTVTEQWGRTDRALGDADE